VCTGSANRDFFSHQSIDVSLIGRRPGSRTLLTDQDRFVDLNTYWVQTQFNSRKFDHYRLSGGIDLARDKTGGDNLAKNGFVDAYGTTVFAPPDEVSQSVPKGNFDSYAGFAQGEWYVHPQWTVSAGARETSYHYQTDAGVNFAASGPQPEVDFQAASVSDNALSGSLGVVYTPRADLHLSANVANGYREPNAQDLFFSGPASVGIVEGNPTLKPEKSVSYDLGLRWAPGAVALSGNLFYSTYDDLIDAIQVQAPVAPGAPSTFQYVNISKTRIWGGETEGEWRFLQNWRVRASLAGAIGDITNRDAIAQLYSVTADQAPLPNVPPFKGSTALRWTDPQGRVWAETAMRFSWRTNRLPLATPGVPQTSEFRKEWLVEDVTVGGRLPGGERLVIGVRNIANRSYTYPLASLEEPGIRSSEVSPPT
jgi:outer membrane receptor protein involved in Fe transport